MRGSGVKAFAATNAGKITLTLVATAVLVLSLIYIGALIAIVAFLLFMLAIPIYLGWKRPRELAVCGLAAILIAGPIGATLYAQQLRTPVGTVGSDPQTGLGGTGSVLSKAAVHPFTGTAGQVYQFTVTLNPQYLPANVTGIEYVVLYLSTCANATSSNDSVCGGSGFPFWEQDQAFNKTPSGPVTVSFGQRLNMSNLWFWTMAFVFNQTLPAKTGTTNVTHWVWLDAQSYYGAVQGPVSGDFLSTTGLVLPLFYEELFLYVALVFFLGLLVYMFLKSRAARRAAESGNVPPPTGGTGPTGGPGSPGGPSAVGANERTCSKCGAVIYPSETSCWKCGQPVGPAPAPPSQPLS